MQDEPKSYMKLRPIGFNKSAMKSHFEIAKNVKISKGYKKIDECPICNCTNFSLQFVQFDIEVVRCLSCSIVYSKMHPNDFSDVYSNQNYFDVAKKNYIDSEKERVELFGNDRVNFIKKYKINFKTILDVGAGTGWFLNYVKTLGINVSAFEYSKQLQDFLISRSINTYGSLDNIAEKFDVITMYDVIEHHPAPVDLLQSVSKLLSENGVIIVYTPNFDSLSFKFLKCNNNLLCPPQHLYYFNRESMKNILTIINLNLVDTCTAGLDFYDINSYFIDNDIESEFNNQASLMQLQMLLDNTGMSNHIRFVISKNEI